MILIVGANGFLGREVAKLLLSKNEKVRLLVRTPAKVDDLNQAGAEVIQGDLIDPASLTHACHGIDRVLAAAHSIVGKGKYKSEPVDDAGHRALIDAAKVAGVAHFVYLSILGASPNHPIDFFRTKYHIEEYLKAGGLVTPFCALLRSWNGIHTSSMASPFWKRAKRACWAWEPNPATL